MKIEIDITEMLSERYADNHPHISTRTLKGTIDIPVPALLRDVLKAALEQANG